MKVEDFANLKKDVRSLLISSKLGLSPEQLIRDYRAMLGYPMPLKQLGFRNVMDMVNEMPEVVSVHFRDNGELYLKAISDETTSKIEELVSKQRLSKMDIKKSKRRAEHFSNRYLYNSTPVIIPRRGCAPPALPGHLRSQLCILLSQGPIRLSDLENCYLRCFGRPLSAYSYGFYSTTEMLLAASDIIAIQQSRMGSLLTLRNTILPCTLSVPFRTTKGTQAVKPKSPKAEQPAPKEPEPRTQTATILPDSVSPLNQSSPDTSLDPSSGSLSVCNERNNQEAEEYHLFEKSVQKLEVELRQRIVENGVAGTISQELKDKLRKVVRATSGGVSVHDLPAEYKKMYGEELPLLQSGFVSITELVGAMTDTFHLKPEVGNDGQSWIVMDTQDSDGTQSDSKDTENTKLPFRSYFLNGGQSPWEAKLEDEVTEDDTVENSNTYKTQAIPAPFTVHVHSSPAVPLDALQSQSIKPPTRRPAQEVFPVLMEQVESPALFYIRVSNCEEEQALEDMMVEMRRCYSSPKVSERYALPKRFVRQGQVCVSHHIMWFYRVVIHRVISPNHVEVYFVDYGGKAVVQSSNLKFLKSCYWVLPAQAVPSSLTGIKPTNGIWTAEATSSFQRLCSEGTLVGIACCYTGDVLQLYLCDSRNGEDYVHAALLSQGHGKLCSPAVSAALCVQANPVTLYMGEGKLELPELEEEMMMTCPEPENTPEQPISTTQKCCDSVFVGQDEDEEPPGLELIYNIDDMPQPQAANIFSTLNDPELSCCELARATSNEFPLNNSTSTPTTSSLPDLIQTQKNQGHCEADLRMVTPPPSTSSVTLRSSCQTPPPVKELQPQVFTPPAVQRILSTHTPDLGLINNCSQGSPVPLLHMYYSGSMFPLFGLGKKLSPVILSQPHVSLNF